MKKALLALALVVSATGASFAQSTAGQVAPGGLYTVPQVNCVTGPCFLQGPYHPTVVTGSQTNVTISSSTALTVPTGANIALVEFQGTANSAVSGVPYTQVQRGVCSAIDGTTISQVGQVSLQSNELFFPTISATGDQIDVTCYFLTSQ